MLARVKDAPTAALQGGPLQVQASHEADSRGASTLATGVTGTMMIEATRPPHPLFWCTMMVRGASSANVSIEVVTDGIVMRGRVGAAAGAGPPRPMAKGLEGPLQSLLAGPRRVDLRGWL